MENPRILQAIQMSRHYETGNLVCFMTTDDAEIDWQYLEQFLALTNTVRSRQFDEQQDKLKRERDRKASNGKR